MKIVHIAQEYKDGWGYHENLLPQYHSLANNEVTIITSTIPKNKVLLPESNQKEYYDGAVKVIRLPIAWQFKGRFVYFKNLYNTICLEKPDYIFHHGITAPSLLVSANYKQNNPAVFLAADNHADLNISGRIFLWRIFYYQILWKLLLRRFIKYIDLIFGVTPARCYFPEKYLGVPKEKIRLLPLGADVYKVNKLGVLLNRLKNTKFTLVTGGKWTKEKELDVLINAVRNLEVELIIFGQLVDSLLEDLIDKVVNVKFLGWKDRKETLNILANADMAVWTKQHTTLIEDSIATETPLLLRYHGSTSHFIRGNGAYLFTGSSIEIRQYIELFISNPNLVDKMRIRAKEMKKVLSYQLIAEESVGYSEDIKPKMTHQFIMGSTLCNPENKAFDRVY